MVHDVRGSCSKTPQLADVADCACLDAWAGYSIHLLLRVVLYSAPVK